MQSSLKRRGGAQIGWLHAGWPFAKLRVSPRAFSISITLSGSYSFAPEQVVALEPYGSIPIIGRGIRVQHAHPEYPSRIVFFTFRNPDQLLEEVLAVGFHPRGVVGQQAVKHGIPVRWEVIAFALVVWNVLFVLDGFVPWREPKAPGPFVLVALGALFVSALSVSFSPRVQSWVLKPGRSVGEIQPFLRLLQIVSGFLLLVMALFAANGWMSDRTLGTPLAHPPTARLE